MSVTPDDGRTHWHGCAQEHGHHACALAELARLRDCRDRWKSMCQQAWNERDDTADSLEHAEAELASLRAELEAMTARKDDAYRERNRVVRALAAAYPSGIARTAIEGWSDDWHGCVYIDLPTGQVSWHYHDSEAALFADLPAYAGQWDGHDTEEKYRRLAALAQEPPA